MNITNESHHALTSGEVATLTAYLANAMAPFEVHEVTILPSGHIAVDAIGVRWHLKDVFPSADVAAGKEVGK